MKWHQHFSAGVVGSLLASLTLSASAIADTTKKDIQISARAVAFMADGPTGDVPTAIVYDPANAASKAEADSIQAIMAGGIKAGKASLKPKLVGTDALGGLSGTKVAFVTGGIGNQHQAIFSEASAQKILTVSTDMGCVDSGKCIVGIASKPKVEIIISKAARDATGIGFKSAFLMMVKEK